MTLADLKAKMKLKVKTNQHIKKLHFILVSKLSNDECCTLIKT